MKKKQVVIETKTIGDSFGTAGVVKDQAGRTLHVCSTTRPYGFIEAATKDAEYWAGVKGYTVVKKAEGGA